MSADRNEQPNSHTPEPWVQWEDHPYVFAGRVVTNDPFRISGGLSICECAGDEDSDLSAREAVANANRIVACVNACAGMADPASEIAALKAQRDDLLAACRWRNGIESCVNAAIAKAEGGAA